MAMKGCGEGTSRQAADQAAAEAFLARHDSLRAARLGELVHPLDHPALVAETADGQLLGMLTYVPGRDWQQCEILTLHADEHPEPWCALDDHRLRAVDEQGLPVVQGAVRGAVGAVPGHHPLDRRRLGMPG